MPIYEFKCPECGQFFEKLVLSQAEEVCCTKCGSPRVEKQMSGFSTSGGEPAGIGSALSSSSCGSGGFS
ncbi:MAG: zinc ribbon domain-containing protein [Deltaproteobacteria bacterium]|nr:zinc ribbon domain-containing protein [Deltaproteobacteria bacterium]